MMKSPAGDAAATTLPAENLVEPVPGEAQRFGDYLLEQEIAHGGMGVVYRARQLSLGRVVAVKLLLLGKYSSAESVERFKREAQSAAALRHPNIVAIHEVGQHVGQHYFSMEFVEGRSLADILHDGPLPPARAAEVAQAVAEAIHYAHQQGVLHRDLKPSNVLIDVFGQVRVTDFGLAKKLDGSSDLTLTGQMVGTPNYLSPEQAAGRNADLGPASDVYAIGALFYELLTGRPPFLAQSLQDTLLRIRDSEPVSPRALIPALDPDLETICLKCLQKEPSRRYPSAGALAEDIERWRQRRPIHARATGPLERIWLWCRRKPRQATMLGLLALTMLAGITGIFVQWQQAETARRRADVLRTRADDARLAAERHQREFLRRAYAADLNLAQQALAENNLGRARELIDRYRPTAAQTNDLRGWEWRYLWQQCRSDAKDTIARGLGSIAAMDVSADGRWLAAGVESGAAVSVWDLVERREVARPAKGLSSIQVAFSPSEPLLACAMARAVPGQTPTFELLLWNPVTRQKVAVLPLGGPCRALGFSSDGRKLVTGTTIPKRQLLLWDVATRSLLASNVAPEIGGGIGTTHAVTPDVRLVALTTPEDHFRVVEIATARVLWQDRGFGAKVNSLAIDPAAKVVAAGYQTPESLVALYDLETGRELVRLSGHLGYIISMKFSADGRTIYTASSDQTIRRWDVETGRNTGVFRGHLQEIWRIAFLPDQRTLVSGASDGEILLWDSEADVSDRSRATLPEGEAYCWRFTPDSRAILVSDYKGRVTRYEAPGFRQSKVVFQFPKGAFDLLLSDDARWLAASYQNREHTLIWDLSDGSQKQHLANGNRMVRLWSFAENNTRLMIVHRNDQTLHEWNLATGREEALVPDFRHWRITNAFPQAITRKSVGREVVARMAAEPANAATSNLWFRAFKGAYSADGRFYAFESGAGTVTVEDASTGGRLAVLRGFLQGIHSIAFSPDGRRMAVGSDDRQAVKLWDTESWQELITLSGRSPGFSMTGFSPDGNHLGSMSGRGIFHVWSAPTWEEIAAAERR